VYKHEISHLRLWGMGYKKLTNLLLKTAEMVTMNTPRCYNTVLASLKTAALKDASLHSKCESHYYTTRD